MTLFRSFTTPATGQPVIPGGIHGAVSGLAFLALLVLPAALLLIAPALPLGAASPSADPGLSSYYAGDQRIELQVVPDLVTVGRESAKDGADDGAAELLTSLGPEAAGASARTLTPGVWLVDLAPETWRAEPRAELDAGAPGSLDERSGLRRSEDRRTASALRQRKLERQRTVLLQALDDPSNDWAYPAYRNRETGTLLYLTPRILVAVEEGVDAARLDEMLPSSLQLVRPLRMSGQLQLALKDPRRDDPLELARRLVEETDWVRWAEPDFIQQWQWETIPNDPLFSDQWHLENTGQGGGLSGADARLPGAWDMETGDGSVVIAVLDDGVQLTHPDLPIYSNPGETLDGMDNDLNGYVDDVNGWDFFSGDNDPDPCTSSGCSAGVGSHGTAVAGVAAATGDNGAGGTGACQDCRILPVRIADHGSGAFTNNANIADAIGYAGEMADVLNNSWGGGSPSAAITTAIQNAAANGRGGPGSSVFFSSGNSASGYTTFTLNGIPAGTWTFTWTYAKDGIVSSGFDTAWLDDVIFQDGTMEDFEDCSGLPTGWSTSGDASWSAVDDQTRARSTYGGQCSIRAGSITHNQTTSVSVTKSFGVSGSLRYSTWPSSDPAGPLTIDDQAGAPECFDFIQLTLFDGMTTFGPYFPFCGTWSNQGNPLQDGTVSYPASVSEAIAVGAVGNQDTRSDYSQWEANELDFLCHSSGGTLGVTTTDLTGTDGYSSTSYTSTFGGTSSASPLCAGIAGLILSEAPSTSSADVRSVMQSATRKIGDLAYVGGRNAVYGYGAVNADLALQAVSPNASITVEKRTIPDGDATSFPFTGDLAGSIADGQQLSSAVTAGTYTTTESVPGGWSLEEIACDDGDSSGDTGTGTATFQVASGEDVTCVFLNCSDTADTTLDLTGVTVTTGMTETYEACDTLTADTFVVQSGATVTFRAGHTIVLEDGVAIGGSFKAVIAGTP